MEFLNNIDWQTLGAQILLWLSALIGFVAWLKKNIANIKQLQSESADLSVQVKYYKAMIKDNQGLRTEISDQKVAMNNLLREFKGVNDKKDAEIASLKQDVKDLIQVIKEKEGI